MEGKTILIWLELVVLIVLMETTVDSGPIADRRGQRNPEDNDYSQDVNYDEYPMVVPRKRAAVLLDRLMVALQKAMDEDTDLDGVDRDGFRKGSGFGLRPDDNLRTMDLQRRGHGGLASQQKGRVYWRCYFNAVTCF